VLVCNGRKLLARAVGVVPKVGDFLVPELLGIVAMRCGGDGGELLLAAGGFGFVASNVLGVYESRTRNCQ
jgi:hypothetical protein